MNNNIKNLIEYTLNEDIKSIDLPIMDYLNLFKNHLSGIQKQMFMDKIDLAQSIEISSILDVFDDVTVEKIKTRIRPLKKGCYLNAYRLCDQFNSDKYEIKYCEGYLNFKGFPIEHAWNSVNGVYVDITAELALEKLTDSYVLLAEFDRSTMWELALQTGTYDGLLNQYLMNKYEK